MTLTQVTDDTTTAVLATAAAAAAASSDDGLDNVDTLIEQLAAWSYATLGESELVKAREEFHALMGKVFPEDSFYDARTGYFLEHFLLERPISEAAGRRLGIRLTPLQTLLARRGESAFAAGSAAKAAALPPLAQLGSFRHSLYAVEKIRTSSLTVRDLLIPETMTIMAKAGQTWRAFERGTIFQGFVIRLATGPQLGTGLVIHPPRVRRQLLRLVEAAKKQKNLEELPILSRMARIHLRHLRHRHVDARTIYASATP